MRGKIQATGLSERHSQVMASGPWLYDGLIPQRVAIIARDRDMKIFEFQGDCSLADGERPQEPGPFDSYLFLIPAAAAIWRGWISRIQAAIFV